MDTLKLESRVLRQLLYKYQLCRLKNSLGRTVQYRRLQEVYKKLRKYIFGHAVALPEVIEKAAMPIRALLARGYHAPACTLILAIYARVYYIVGQREAFGCTPLTRLKGFQGGSRNLKMHLRLSRKVKCWTKEGSELYRH